MSELCGLSHVLHPTVTVNTLYFPQVDDRLPILKMTSTRERLIWAKDLIEGVASEGGTRGCMIM